jgi:predicted small metal-binding protein
MTQCVHCECGHKVQGETDDEIVAAVQEHVKEAHPELEGQMSREQILDMAHEH